MAASGPLLVAVTVKVTFWPRLGAALLTLLLTAMSAARPRTVAEAASFATLGSDCASAVFVAVFVTLLLPVTVAVMVSVDDAPVVSDPTVQTPVPLLYVPWPAVAETKVRPAGNRSVTWTPVALLGPLLVAVTVKATFWPAIGEALLTVFVIAMSALLTTVVGSDAVSLPVLASAPPETEAVLVSEFEAACETDTGMLIAGYEAPAASASERVQVTVWGEVVQAQPVPVAVPGTRPAGRLSVIVTVPLVGTLPLLLTVTL